MPTTVPLPPDDELDDALGVDPLMTLVNQDGAAAVTKMMDALRTGLGSVLADRLSTAALAAALMEKRSAKGCRSKMNRKTSQEEALETSVEIAILFGWCPGLATKPQRRRGGQKVRNEVKWGRDACQCRPGHKDCPDPCLLKQGRQLLAELLQKAKEAVTVAEFDLAFDTIERIR